MRRTSISLAIVALLLCGQGYGQAVSPLGESLAPGVAEPMPGTLLPLPDAAGPVPPVIPPAPTAPPQSANAPQNGAIPLQGRPQQGQQAMTYSADPSMLQPQAMADDYPTADGSNVWNQPMVDGPCDQSCAFPGCALCGAGTGCPNNWYVDQRVRIMTHPRPRAKTFGAWRNIGLNQFGQEAYFYNPATSSRSLPFDLAASYEVTLGHYLGLDTYNRDHFLEFTFYGTNHWGEGGSVLANVENNAYFNAAGDPIASGEVWTTRTVYGNIYGGPIDAAGFNRATAQWAEYKSSLNNFEVNLQIRPRPQADRLVLHKNGKWRRQCQQGIFCDWLAGARLFSMNESYMFYSTALFTTFNNIDQDPISRGKATGVYQTRTKNTLLGLQVGPDWTYRNCRAEFGLGVKLAAYVNFAEQETGINISGADADPYSDQQNLNVNGSVAKNTCATSIQMDFHAAYKVRPNFILRADYELLYMAGLALAPEQVNMGLDQSLNIGTGGSLLFQSAMLGAEYSW